ncbi:MAG: hypothetical protein Q9163_001857 [Psora crenata]
MLKMAQPSTCSTLSVLATLTPPSPSRAWQTAPHPTLPLLATCSSDKTVRIYSLTSYTLLSTIHGGHKRSIRACAWKPNLKGQAVLATASFDASVGIWRRWDEGELIAKPERDFAVAGVGVNGGGEEEEEEEDDDEWKFAIVLDGHDSEVKDVAYSAGGNFLATCSRDKSVWIWEEVGEDDYETVAVLQEHEGDVKCVAWHPEEELLASGSYDDEVRLWRDEGDDWGCVWVGRAHGATVGGVCWEGLQPVIYDGDAVVTGGYQDSERRRRWTERREKAGPRLMTCSDDGTIRVWRRRPKERLHQSRLSIIKSPDSGEDWVEEAVLPAVHIRGIYAAAWSQRSGRVVSTGGDGMLVVYQEDWVENAEQGTMAKGGETHAGSGPEGTAKMDGLESHEEPSTVWRIIAQIDTAHGVFEINHAAWASKPKIQQGLQGDGEEELIITTGDDGAVKVWELNK